MGATLQGSSEIMIQTGPERIWAILEDSTLLPHWVPMVKQTTCASGQKERAGAVRTCHIEMNGRKNEVEERCVECVPHQRIFWLMERDSLGFSDMLSDYVFGFILEPKGEGITLVRLENYYQTRGAIGRLMNALMVKRKLHGLRKTMLDHLKRFAERPYSLRTSDRRQADETTTGKKISC